MIDQKGFLIPGNPHMAEYLLYIYKLMTTYWSEDALKFLQNTMVHGYEVPFFKKEDDFWRWYNRLYQFTQMESYLKKNDGFVYLFKAVSKVNGQVLAYKIGCSNNPERRVEQVLGSKQPFVEVNIEHTIKTDDMDKLETRYHKQYAAKRLDGEWFALDNEDVEQLKQIKGVIFHLDITSDRDEFKQFPKLETFKPSDPDADYVDTDAVDTDETTAA